MDGSNTLNRSMQGLWSTHRKAKLNINSTPDAPSPIPTPPASSSRPLTVEEAHDESSSRSQLAPSDSTKPPSTKRKIRSIRTEDAKRAKVAATNHEPPSARLSDLGGVDASVEKMLELVAMPLCHPEIYMHTGVQPPRGVLLHGPPGCGKTLLANAIAGELGIPFISISAPSIVSGMSGESEKTLRDTFDEAKRCAPCLLFIDEIDAVTPKRESAQREMERRIVAQFLTCMDDLSWDKTENKPVVVIGATNRPDALDAALRRAGRFDHEIAMGVPDETSRERILRVQCSKLRLSGSFDYAALARATPGYVGADLASLTGAAGVIAVKRIFRELAELEAANGVVAELPARSVDTNEGMVVDSETSTAAASALPPSDLLASSSDDLALDAPFANLVAILPPLPRTIAHFLASHPGPLSESQLEPLQLTQADFTAALRTVQPSSTREGFSTAPAVTWSSIGSLHATREELGMAIVQPIRRPEVFRQVGIRGGCGVLMWGPPGCGKTLLARAVAGESKANFISVKGPEVLNKYVGESERAVRQIFARARASAPCIVFFDELDALVPRRDDSLSESSARVVNTLLTELDGLDTSRSATSAPVYVIGATNRPDMIDPAMVRPGRLDKLLYVDLPDRDGRAEVLRALVLSSSVPLSSSDGTNEGIEKSLTEIEALVQDRCDGFSGADIAALVREAGVVALRRMLGRIEMDEARDAVLSEARAQAQKEGGQDQDQELKVRVTPDDFRAALSKVSPSVSVAQRRKYEALRAKFAGLPVRGSKREQQVEEEVEKEAAVASGQEGVGSAAIAS
ncbi:AAA-domain-containing protein [Coniophora puteana RWD-64-598 SS2]|uniref:AAA-domain-containing protein n=1 Tax=Coniophora puteana (strain RWD-64-598) TaxID=741705 RepID=A0A5M3MXH1_CONPW|nr:AAA-domain-containing protein [Coniophora puteana RWD-64-598 SS2]EIW83792.1 AAA-domain-containing protein [Coniophora puteana RWD-64-598 SS2]